MEQKKKKIPTKIRLKDGTVLEVPQDIRFKEKWISARLLIDRVGLPKELEDL